MVSLSDEETTSMLLIEQGLENRVVNLRVQQDLDLHLQDHFGVRKT